MIHYSTDYIPIFLENVAWKAPFATLSSNNTTSECENVLKTLATGPAVAHPYSFWSMDSSPGALSFLTGAPSVLWILLFLSLLQHSQFNWWCCLYLLVLYRCSYWRHIENTEFLHGVNSVVDSFSLPPPPAEQLWSKSPWSTCFTELRFLALQITLLERSLTLEGFFSRTLDIFIILHWVMHCLWFW